MGSLTRRRRSTAERLPERPPRGQLPTGARRTCSLQAVSHRVCNPATATTRNRNPRARMATIWFGRRTGSWLLGANVNINEAVYLGLSKGLEEGSQGSRAWPTGGQSFAHPRIGRGNPGFRQARRPLPARHRGPQSQHRSRHRVASRSAPSWMVRTVALRRQRRIPSNPPRSTTSPFLERSAEEPGHGDDGYAAVPVRRCRPTSRTPTTSSIPV